MKVCLVSAASFLLWQSPVQVHGFSAKMGPLYATNPAAIAQQQQQQQQQQPTGSATQEKEQAPEPVYNNNDNDISNNQVPYDDTSSFEEPEITYGRMDEDEGSPFGHARRMAAQALGRRTDSFYASGGSRGYQTRSFVNDWWDRSGRPQGYYDPVTSVYEDDENYYYDEEEDQQPQPPSVEEKKKAEPSNQNNMNDDSTSFAKRQQQPEEKAPPQQPEVKASTDVHSEEQPENAYGRRPIKDLFSMPPRMANDDKYEPEPEQQREGPRDLFSMPPRQGRHRIMPEEQEQEQRQETFSKQAGQQPSTRSDARYAQDEPQYKNGTDDDYEQPRDLFSFPHRQMTPEELDQQYYTNDDNDNDYRQQPDRRPTRDLFSMPPRQGSHEQEGDDTNNSSYPTQEVRQPPAQSTTATASTEMKSEDKETASASAETASTESAPRKNYSPFGNKPVAGQ